MIENNSIMTSLRFHICNHCGLKIEKKREFESHVIICGIVQTTKKRESPAIATPSVEDLYKVVCELALKCEQLEKTVQSLRLEQQHQQQTGGTTTTITVKRKVRDVIGDLSIPSMSWKAWLATVEVDRENVLHIMENSLINTICQVLNSDKICNASSTIPFHKESKNIYACDKGIWSVCSPELFTELTMKIYSSLVDQLSIWGKENKQQMRIDKELSSQYEDAMTKVFEFNSTTYPNKIRLEFIKT